ncbi:DUF1360 domain-containing protein [Bacillus fonticola]|uniref:DUF1360 domain-containing protein n=1 Tax=Bacillus fonticola TaxID=2728853 RepID=UPI0014744B43|nr:DUF1360 domain-containing protein [Bacillus fonticola]
MELSWLTFLLLCLASFRLTRLLVFDQITGWLRRPFLDEWEETVDGKTDTYVQPRNGWRGWVGELLTCYWCTGIWVSIGLYGGMVWLPNVMRHVLVILAIAGIAAIIETIVQTWLKE